jgi:TolC family type I secretion outer membrane protein
LKTVTIKAVAHRAPPIFLAAFLLCTGIKCLADPGSDTFDPDVFGTSSALRHRTTSLSDPAGRDCRLPSSALTFPEAVDLALCRNPSTRAAWGAARQQAAALGSAESAWLPTITSTASESRTSGGEHADALGFIESTAQNNRDAAITLAWTLFDFGGRTSRIRSARYLLDAAAATLNRTVQQTVLSVVQDYYGVVAADDSLASAITTEETAVHSLTIAQALQQGGVATLGDVLQAQTAADQATLARIQAEAAAQSARGTLAAVLGFAADQPLKLEPEAMPTEVPALTARLSDLIGEASRQRPDLAAALAQRDSAEADVTTARAQGRPSISFQGGRTIADTTGVPNQTYNQVGIYISVPIFTGFNVGYQVRQAQAILEQRDAGVEQVRQQVSLDVWNAYYSLNSSNQQLVATGRLTETAAKNQEVAVGRYQSGVGTIIDVLTAQTAAANARQLRINAELGWQVSRAQLALALGRLTGAMPLRTEAAVP